MLNVQHVPTANNLHKTSRHSCMGNKISINGMGTFMLILHTNACVHNNERDWCPLLVLQVMYHPGANFSST